MLTVREIQAHLARLQYKPGWEFEVYEGAWEGPHIAIRTNVPDAYGADPVALDVRSPLPPMPSVDYLETWLQWRLNILETHEAREFLRRDGRPVFDPHAPYAERDLWGG